MASYPFADEIWYALSVPREARHCQWKSYHVIGVPSYQAAFGLMW